MYGNINISYKFINEENKTNNLNYLILFICVALLTQIVFIAAMLYWIIKFQAIHTHIIIIISNFREKIRTENFKESNVFNDKILVTNFTSNINKSSKYKICLLKNYSIKVHLLCGYQKGWNFNTTKTQACKWT